MILGLWEDEPLLFVKYYISAGLFPLPVYLEFHVARGLRVIATVLGGTRQEARNETEGKETWIFTSLKLWPPCCASLPTPNPLSEHLPPGLEAEPEKDEMSRIGRQYFLPPDLEFSPGSGFSNLRCENDWGTWRTRNGCHFPWNALIISVPAALATLGQYRLPE